MPFTPPCRFDASSFSIFQRSLMRTDELPLADIVDDSLLEHVFEKHGVEFGTEEDAVYTPAVTLWALISQVCFAAEQRSCKAAVLRVASLWAALGRRVCDTNTGAFCRARLKIPFGAVRDLVQQIALAADDGVSNDDIDEDSDRNLSPRVVGEVRSLAQSGRVLLLDGFVIAQPIRRKIKKRILGIPFRRKVLGFRFCAV